MCVSLVIVLRLFRCFCVEVSISLLFCCCFRNHSVTQFGLGLPPSVSCAHTCAQVCYCPAGAFLFFHMSQTWRISQDANKSNGVCAVCLATRQLHHRDGNVHRHGPRDNPCPGSNKPPLSVGKQKSADQSQAMSADASSAGPVTQTQFSCNWSPGNFKIIKHIPKSARASCATHLSSLLRSVVSNPASVNNWLGLFNWAGSILQPAKRGGKRHNLSTTLRNRISSFAASAMPENLTDSRFAKTRQATTESMLCQAVTAKLEEGNMRAAIRLLMSDDTPASPSVESLASGQASGQAPFCFFRSR